jgi:elongation factor G
MVKPAQTIISGMGELPWSNCDKLQESLMWMQMSEDLGFIQETITREIQVEGKYIRQSGGKGQYGM